MGLRELGFRDLNPGRRVCWKADPEVHGVRFASVRGLSPRDDRRAFICSGVAYSCPVLDSAGTVAELQELHALTGNAEGAQRVCWTETWLLARSWFREKLEALPVQVETDEAGNLWGTLPGDSERAVLIGGHLDSVSNGGWLDGCLNVLAWLEVLRRIAREGRPKAIVRLVDWADEEGFASAAACSVSSAVSGSLVPGEFRDLRDVEGALPDVLETAWRRPRSGVEARRQLANAAAYVEPISSKAPCWNVSAFRWQLSSAPMASSATSSGFAASVPTPARRRWTCAAILSRRQPAFSWRGAASRTRRRVSPRSARFRLPVGS
jgi:hypothetical protein